MDVKIDVSEKTSRALQSALTAPAACRMLALTDLLAAALEDGYLAGVKGVMAEMGPIAELIQAKRIAAASLENDAELVKAGLLPLTPENGNIQEQKEARAFEAGRDYLKGVDAKAAIDAADASPSIERAKLALDAKAEALADDEVAKDALGELRQNAEETDNVKDD